MFLLKEKMRAAAAAVLLAGLIVFCWQISLRLRNVIESGRETSGNVSEEGSLVMIDPGHGGADPGKIGVNEAEEKDINLQIALKIQNILSEEDISVMMTRSTDERLADSQVEDLRARVDMINKNHPVLTVSIHQNSYSDGAVRGAQVFYFESSKEGEAAAGYIQNALGELDPENAKQIKANNTYYLLKNTEVPVVIAECGFLSNYEEAEMLIAEEYQTQVAEAVAAGVLQYLQAESEISGSL